MIVRTTRLVMFLGASLAVGCGGAGTSSRTIPHADDVSVAFLPEDAFFVARVDFAAMRAAPGWEAIAASMPETSPEAARSMLTTNALYFAVGGLVDVSLPAPRAPAPTHGGDIAPITPPADPSMPPVDEPAPEDDEAAAPDVVLGEMGISEVPAEPDWVSLARNLGGKLPLVVATLEGSDVSQCLELAEGETAREVDGFRVAVKDGWAIALRGRELCLMTYEPTLEHALRLSGRGPRIFSRLAGSGENGDFGIVGVALELGTPAFRAISAAFPDDTDEGEDTGRYLALAGDIVDVLIDDIDAVVWQLGRSGASFASRTRVYASDMDRAIMWRELTEVYLGIIRAVSESGVAGLEITHTLDTILENTRLEETDDGFTLVARVPDQTITSLLDSSMASLAGPDMDGPLLGGSGDFSSMFFDDPDLPARERIGALEARREEMRGRPAHVQYMYAQSLARAYAHVGRFDAALALLDEVGASTTEATVRAVLAADAAELLADLGRIDVAKLKVVQALASCEADAECDTTDLELRAFLLRSFEGEEAALTELDAALGELASEDVEHVVLRGRVLLALGRFDEAAGVLGTACAVSRFSACGAPRTRTALAEALARSTLPLAQVLTRLAPFRPDESATGRATDALATIDAFECYARAERAPADRATKEQCERAMATAIAEHGDTHPVTAIASLAYARVLAATRDAAGVRRELARVDAALATLGPSHPLRARRAAFNARGR